MKSKMMKKSCAVLLVLACFCAAGPVWAEEAEESVSGVSWILQQYYGKKLSEKSLQQARLDEPAVECAMGIEVTFDEIAADGKWVVTSAKIRSTDPAVLAMPGSATRGDRVCGMNGEQISEDQRSYSEVAQEENKQLVAVYVYPAEFDSDSCGSYFLDHLLTSADSFLMMSGANCPLKKDKAALTWSIEVHTVDSATGSYSLVERKEVPATVSLISEKMNLE